MDKVLAAIDAGLQTSVESSFSSDDWSPSPTPTCVRCRGPVDDGGTCGQCRAFLLGDTDLDPALGVTIHADGQVSGYLLLTLETVDTIQRYEALRRAFESVGEEMTATLQPLLDFLAEAMIEEPDR